MLPITAAENCVRTGHKILAPTVGIPQRRKGKCEPDGRIQASTPFRRGLNRAHCVLCRANHPEQGHGSP